VLCYAECDTRYEAELLDMRCTFEVCARWRYAQWVPVVENVNHGSGNERDTSNDGRFQFLAADLRLSLIANSTTRFVRDRQNTEWHSTDSGEKTDIAQARQAHMRSPTRKVWHDDGLVSRHVN